jgi:hypothetical protein
MKHFLFFVVFIVASFHSTAQTKQDEHLLDGTSLDIHYETGSHEHVAFKNGQIISEWVAGPGKDAAGQEGYRSKKIGNKTYVVSFLKTPSHSFVTLIFNFSQNVLYASAIRGVGTKDEAFFLEEATIEHLLLKEKNL